MAGHSRPKDGVLSHAHGRPKDGVLSHANVPATHVLIDANATAGIRSQNPFREMVPRLAILFNGAL